MGLTAARSVGGSEGGDDDEIGLKIRDRVSFLVLRIGVSFSALVGFVDQRLC